MFSPVVKVTTAQAIVDKILEMYRQGTLKPGDKLASERDLMEQLNVGRSSVREALQILATLNLVEVVHGYGTIVKEPQPADILRSDVMAFLIGDTMSRELLEAREIIEPASTRLACLRGTDDDFQRIDAILQAHAQALSAHQPVTELSAQFHLALAEASHNRVVVRFMDSILELLTERGRKMEGDLAFSQWELDEHRAIFALVRERDDNPAQEAMLRHIVHSATVLDLANIA